ncbi:DNA cytosine methyltransferase [Streptomyces sp. NPDC050095]|uniref:DNA cytosine methyltransferase n=1 Tax=unclassified Streptomyces TaxID=2593676 RepID=UPI0034263E7E
MTAGELAIGSLCSGIGGLDLGAQVVLGGRIAWHAETDPRALKALNRHWPGTPNLGDVRTAGYANAEPVDILTLGLPCQDLSVAGPRTGLAGPRSGLWRHIAAALPILNPKLLVVENVRGLLSTRAGTHPDRDVEPCATCLGNQSKDAGLRALGALLADLADLGMDARWCVLRASDIGAPHQRARTFLAAWPSTPHPGTAAEDPDGEPGGERRLAAPSQTQSGRPRTQPRRRDRTSPADPQSERRPQGFPTAALQERHPHPGLYCGRPCGGTRPRGFHPAAAHADFGGCARRCGYHPEAQGRHEPPHGDHSPAAWWGEFAPAIHRWERVTGHAAPRPTLPGTRRLSADFVAWMMGLDGIPGLSRAAQLHLLGNAVVPQQAAHALEILVGGALKSPRVDEYGHAAP